MTKKYYDPRSDKKRARGTALAVFGIPALGLLAAGIVACVVSYILSFVF